MERKTKGTVGASSNAKQQKRSFSSSEIGAGVRADDTINAEKRGECFAPSVASSVLDKHHGFGKVREGGIDYQGNKGHGTLSSDDRNAPLPEDCPKIDLNQMRNREAIIDGAPLVTDGKTVARK